MIRLLGVREMCRGSSGVDVLMKVNDLDGDDGHKLRCVQAHT